MSSAPPRRNSPWDDPSPLGWRTRVRRWWFHQRPPRDPWARVAAPVEWPALLQSPPLDWRAFFDGRCTTPVTSLADVCEWLAGCRYQTDRERGHARDSWMHPLEFEHCRVGDCEEFALWAWRRLAELNYATEFVVGLFEPASPAHMVNHAWVHVHDGRQLWVLEGTACRRDRMLLPLEAARAAYLPAASIDHRFESHEFANVYHFRTLGRSMPLPGRSVAANPD